ncbi:MAG: hypothetical protein Q8N18_20695 [Opitutaceae bacterium]|nr:hypothetical protein [Opitutaceae bacterium]
MSDYLSELRKAIKAVHGCDGTHIETVPVKEVFQGKTAWDGAVEVFAVDGHPKAKRCYAWGYKDREEWAITSVLEIPPVVSPETAVKVAIAAYARKAIPRL